MLATSYYSQNYSRIIIASLIMTDSTTTVCLSSSALGIIKEDDLHNSSSGKQNKAKITLLLSYFFRINTNYIVCLLPRWQKEKP